MKILTKILFTLLLSTLSWTSLGAGQPDRDLDICTLELKAYFSKEATFLLVDKRRALRSSRLRIAVRLDADNSQLTDCWIPGPNTSDSLELVLNAPPERQGLIVARD